ncbi:MAG TPA: hypothetical protein VIZ58_09845 [Thermoanaerobaculia bacterium]
MDEKRLESTREKREKSPWRDGWLGAAMGLLLIAGALLSVAGAPANPVTGRSSAAVSADTTSPGAIANADRDVLELQLD